MAHTLHDKSPQDVFGFSLDAVSSNTIKAARFGCVFFMCFVHIYGQQYITTPTMLTAKSIIMDVFGRASVPLLSAISGYLAVVTLTQTPLRDIAKKKLTSLIIPMVFWNFLVIIVGIALFTALSVTISFYEHIQTRTPFEILTQCVLSLNYEGVQTSHNFLRDVFVCFLLFPLIYKATQLVAPLVIVVTLVIMYTIGTAPVIYREHIILFFALGVVAGRYRITVPDLTRFGLVSLPLLVIVIAAQLYAPFLAWLQDTLADYNLIKRLIVAHAMLCLAQQAAKRVPGYTLDTLSEITFVGFLMHNLFFAITWTPFLILFKANEPTLYPLYFFLAPVVLWAMAYLVWRGIRHVPKTIQIMTVGKSYKI